MTESTFEIETLVENGRATVRISGDADIRNLQRIEDELASLTRQQPSQLLYDLDGLNMLASLAIGALVACASSVRKRGGRVRTINAGEQVAETLRIVKLDEILGLEA